MKILYVCRAPIVPGTAVEAHVVGLVAAWVRAGHAVTLWTPNPPRGCPAASRTRRLGLLAHRLSGPWREGLRETGPDRVYVRWCVSEGPALAAAAAAEGVPCFVEVNGILEEEIPAWNRPARWRAARAARETGRRAAGLVVPTAGVRRHFVSVHGIPQERILAVGNGVDPEAFAPQDRADCRARLGLPQEARLVAFVGNVQTWHGVEVLVAAFARLATRDPLARLAMVGDGPARPAAEKAARSVSGRDRILWRGRVPRAEVPLWIGAADVCAVLWEPVRSDPGSSVKLLEYMAAARPVVASDVPEYAEPVRAADAGRVAPLSDPETLAALLEEILSLPEEARAAMGRRGRAYVSAHRTWRHVADEILAFMGAP